MTKTHASHQLPLRALQIFEAAARHQNFTAAGQQIGITQSAVSRKISELEAILGVALFRRSGPNLTLTEIGRTLSGRVEYALSDLQRAMTHARAGSDTGVVDLSMLPSVAAKWLAPKLGQFTIDHPEIDLRISASRTLVDFAAESIDGAIRYGLGDWPGLDVIWLGSETVQPVCAPMFLDQYFLDVASDLVKVPLLHADIPEDWTAWLAASGVTDVEVPRGPRLGDDTAILQAALSGQGVALGRAQLVRDDLGAGRLVAPFNLKLETSYSYWFVSPKNGSESLAIVRGWIVREFGLN